jgi:hypothetical protein
LSWSWLITRLRSRISVKSPLRATSTPFQQTRHDEDRPSSVQLAGNKHPMRVIERYRPLLTGYWPLLDARKKLRRKTTPAARPCHNNSL